MIEFRGVDKSVPVGDSVLPVLRDVSLSVERGTFVGIIGASGSGKSTLLNILGLLDAPTGGEFRLDGQLVSRMTEAERDRLRSRRFGFVFQAFHLMRHRSVVDNVAVGLLHAGFPRAERHDRAVTALAAVGLSARAEFPAGALSGGESQRVAIARAVAGSKEVLLCDEPTGNLDSSTGQEILELLGRLNERGLTVIMVTHDARVSALCDQVVELRDGCVTADRRQPRGAHRA